ncbi:type I-E CRISPR-associated protein Cas5/CasD, partial [Streptomyces neyagawaensis]
ADLTAVLRAEPWQAAAWYRRQRCREATVSLTVLREARPDEADADLLRDQPLSFAAEHRRHALRPVVTTTVQVPNPSAKTAPATRDVPAHDPFAALEEEST